MVRNIRQRKEHVTFSPKGYIGLIVLLIVILGALLAGGVSTSTIKNPQQIVGTLINTTPPPGKNSLQLRTLNIITQSPQISTSPVADCGYTITSGHECVVIYGYKLENNDLKLFYDDESAMPLGQPGAGKTVTQMGSTCPAHAVGPLQVGDPSVRDSNKYPFFPAAFFTNITTNPNSPYPGDAQNGGTPVPPDEIYGAWKSNTTGDPNQCGGGNGNGTNIGSPDPYPPVFTGHICDDHTVDTSWTAEVIWHLANHSLVSGNSYRVQFAMHDGDQNGNDVGDGCVTFTAP